MKICLNGLDEPVTVASKEKAIRLLIDRTFIESLLTRGGEYGARREFEECTGNIPHTDMYFGGGISQRLPRHTGKRKSWQTAGSVFCPPNVAFNTNTSCSIQGLG
jgi:hypothetical protein